LSLSSQDLHDSFLNPDLNELLALYEMPKEIKDQYLSSKGYKDENAGQTPTRLYQKLIEYDQDNFSTQAISYFANQLAITSFSTKEDARVLVKQLEKDLSKSQSQEITWGKKYQIAHDGKVMTISLSFIDLKTIVTIEGPKIEEGSESNFLDAVCNCMQLNLEGNQGPMKSQECLMKLTSKYPVQFSKSMNNDQEMFSKLSKHCPTIMNKVKEKMGR